MRVLILGGTGEAAELAAKVANVQGIEAITSLAGRTRQPSLPLGDLRIGGFGGVTGLVNYLHQMKIDVLIDATHPFAAQIASNASEAAITVNIPRLKLIRPPWQQVNGDRWIEVDSIKAAAAVVENQSKRVFLSIGRQEIGAFAHLQLWFLMRMIDPPEAKALVPPGKLLCARGPFHLHNEREMLIHHQIDTIVSKNSGGEATYAKLVAARELNLPVVMVKRPPLPPGEQVTDIDQALLWVYSLLGKRPHSQ
ncbi:cobalt-precorrin-6A reductase [Anabaena sp. CS-542/02]|uniref:cobalt-precorrin-6A reductase n=1 Tax=Anabaena sp. CS-542/02 TaxID=3021719 RepID=UPI00232EE94F|nr:cobalt-precorrin-6A reductase [Anabaena sp. CS-542/02]MDB9447299.1 cobalt-precorrin-6A reductase [Anabaena sp. CS-542/02]